MFFADSARLVFKARLLNTRGERSARRLGLDSSFSLKIAGFLYFLHSFGPFGANETAMAPKVASRSCLGTGLGAKLL